MSPEQERSFEGDSQRQKVQAMLGSITDAIAGEDYEFAAQTALGQELVSPADVVEYVHLQAKGEEDPVAQRRIRDGVNSIVASLHERDQIETTENKERSLTNDDVERINKVMQDMELQELAESEVLAEEPDMDASQHIEPNYDWDQDFFSPDLSGYTDEEIEKARNSVGFKMAVEEAQETSTAGREHHIGNARRIIDQHASDQQGSSSGDVASWAYERLSRIGSRPQPTEEPSQPDPPQPKPITYKMLASLDKHIARAAREEAQETSTAGREHHIGNARRIIEYASSPERARAMLDELGL